MLTFCRKIALLFLTLIIGCFFSATPAGAKGWTCSIENSSAKALVVSLTNITLDETTEIIGGKAYSRLSISGGGLTWETGAPQLPTISESFAIPPDTKTSFTILSSDVKTFTNYSICPAPDISTQSDKTGEQTPFFTYQPNNEYYDRDNFAPPFLAKLGQEIVFRSERLGTITFYPVQYNPRQKTLRIYSRVRIAIQFQSVQKSLPKTATRRLDQRFFRKVFDHILNPEIIEGSAGKGAQPPSSRTVGVIPAQRAKIWTQKQGIYSLTPEQLQRSGVNLAGENPKTFKITYKDKEIPILVTGEEDGKFDPQDKILFYAELLHGDSTYYNRYTDRNIYWLSWGGDAGMRFESVPGGIPQTPYAAHFQDTLHLEEDTYYFPGLNDFDTHNTENVQAEGFYWTTLSTGSYIFIYPRLDYLDANSDSIRIRIRLYGVTALLVSQNKNHRIQILLNDKEIGIADFPGVQEYIFSKSIPRNLANTGINTVTINNILTGANDLVLFDWAEFDYEKQYTATDNILSFVPSPEGKTDFSIANFTETPEFIFDYNRGISFINLATQQQNNLYSIRFSDTTHSSEDKRYYAVSPSGFFAPDSLTPVNNPDLLGQGNRADYLIITHPSLLSSASAFKDMLDKTGAFTNGVLVVTVEDIYDLFNYGIKSPLAIKQFLAYAYKQWSAVPSFVAMWGDASWGFDKKLSDKKYIDLVPSYGYPVSDTWYVELEGPDNYLPDMYLGRIPVKNNTEGLSFIKKLQEYNLQEPVIWQKNVLFINGGFNTFEQSLFQNQARFLHGNFSGKPPSAMNGIFVNRTDTTQAIDYSHRDQILQIINNGAILINSMGHGSLHRYDIDYGDPQDLDNQGKYPFMVGMSCNTGGFADPFGSSLAESYVLIEEKGAAAYFGTTGWGFIQLDNSITEGLYRHIFRDNEHRIGPAGAYGLFTLYQQWIPVLDKKSQIYQEVVNLLHQYTVMGDPSLELPIASLPDFAVSPQQIVPENELPNKQDSPLNINIVIFNQGLVPSDSVKVRITVEKSGQNPFSIGEFLRPPFAVMDTFAVLWDFSGKTGEYTLKVSIDPDNRITEVTKANNSAVKTITISETGIDLLNPPSFQRIANDTTNLIVSLPGVFPRSLANIFCEIDTSPNFDKPFFQIGPVIEDTVVNTIHVRMPYNDKTYFWRSRSYNPDVSSYSPWTASLFTYTAGADPASWFQDVRSFAQQGILNHLAVQNTLQLGKHNSTLRAVSAGQFDGDYALLEIDHQPLSITGYDSTFQGTFYAQGFMVTAIDPITATPLWAINFNTNMFTSHSEGMAQYIQNLPAGTIVMAAVKYDGANNLTASAIEAFHSIGSKAIDQLTLVGSFACIGFKGAPLGSIKEQALPRAGGRVEVIDSITVQDVQGSLLSPEISGSSKWKSLTWEGDFSKDGTKFSLDIMGWNRTTNAWDTLRQGVSENPPLNLTFISNALYPKIKLRANFSSNDGKNSPELRSWQLNFDPSPEYILNYRLIKTSPDTLYPGDPLIATAFIKNIGSSSGDSLRCRFSLLDAQNHPVYVYPDISLSAIPNNSLEKAIFAIPSIPGIGPFKLMAAINPDQVVPEISFRNNSGVKPLLIYADTRAPDIKITFSGITIQSGDYVPQQPDIIAEIADDAAAGIADTSMIKVFLDHQLVPLGNNPDIDVQFIEHDLHRSVRIHYTPFFSAGKHSLILFAIDRTKNQASFSIEFQVDEQFRILNVYNYPNPFSRDTQFTYSLTQMAEDVYIKIYTVAGRLIRTLGNAPGFAGFNTVYWDGTDEEGDRLANGTYFYRLVAKNGSKQTSLTEKIVVMR